MLLKVEGSISPKLLSFRSLMMLTLLSLPQIVLIAIAFLFRFHIYVIINIISLYMIVAMIIDQRAPVFMSSSIINVFCFLLFIKVKKFESEFDDKRFIFYTFCYLVYTINVSLPAILYFTTNHDLMSVFVLDSINDLVQYAKKHETSLVKSIENIVNDYNEILTQKGNIFCRKMFEKIDWPLLGFSEIKSAHASHANTDYNNQYNQLTHTFETQQNIELKTIHVDSFTQTSNKNILSCDTNKIVDPSNVDSHVQEQCFQNNPSEKTFSQPEHSLSLENNSRLSPRKAVPPNTINNITDLSPNDQLGNQFLNQNDNLVDNENVSSCVETQIELNNCTNSVGSDPNVTVLLYDQMNSSPSNLSSVSKSTCSNKSSYNESPEDIHQNCEMSFHVLHPSTFDNRICFSEDDFALSNIVPIAINYESELNNPLTFRNDSDVFIKSVDFDSSVGNDASSDAKIDDSVFTFNTAKIPINETAQAINSLIDKALKSNSVDNLSIFSNSIYQGSENINPFLGDTPKSKTSDSVPERDTPKSVTNTPIASNSSVGESRSISCSDTSVSRSISYTNTNTNTDIDTDTNIYTSKVNTPDKEINAFSSANQDNVDFNEGIGGSGLGRLDNLWRGIVPNTLVTEVWSSNANNDESPFQREWSSQPAQLTDYSPKRFFEHLES